MKYGVLAYKGTLNLGDAVQSVAMSRILPSVDFSVYRNRSSITIPKKHILVVNGYLREKIPSENCVYSGLYFENGAIGRFEEALRDSCKIIGARDPFSFKLLQERGIQSELIGCATATLQRYAGPRSGEYSYDCSPSNYTQYIDRGMSWDRQWYNAVNFLKTVASAECITTTRLHVALPCLALGTPVKIPWSTFRKIGECARLSILDEMGFEYDKFNEIDVKPWADRYKKFLYTQLGITDVSPSDKNCPLPI